MYSLGISFDYGLKLGSFKGDSYLKLMNWQADKAAKHLAKTGQITVIVQDNHPIHKSKEVCPIIHRLLVAQHFISQEF